jgi:prepilin-type N-terminal cleavage/methylation domain-containing protein
MSNWSTRPAIRRGFTFVELVVVISIIAALAAIGFPVWGMISTRVKVNATDALVNSVATAITTYQTKTWTWNIEPIQTNPPRMRTYHIFDLNHFGTVENPPPNSPGEPDLPDAPNGAPRFFSIDGYTAPENLPFYSGTEFVSSPTETNPEANPAPPPYDVNFHLAILKSGYRGFINMAQPQIKKSFINKRGQVVDAWGRPLRIAFAAKVYGTQAFGIWSAGVDKLDDLKTRKSSDDLRSWKTQGAE